MKFYRYVAIGCFVLALLSVKGQSHEIEEEQVDALKSDSINFKTQFLNYSPPSVYKDTKSNSLMFKELPLKPAAAFVVSTSSFILNRTSADRSQTSLKSYLDNVGKVYNPPINRQSTVVLTGK